MPQTDPFLDQFKPVPTPPAQGATPYDPFLDQFKPSGEKSSKFGQDYAPAPSELPDLPDDETGQKLLDEARAEKARSSTGVSGLLQSWKDAYHQNGLLGLAGKINEQQEEFGKKAIGGFVQGSGAAIKSVGGALQAVQEHPNKALVIPVVGPVLYGMSKTGIPGKVGKAIQNYEAPLFNQPAQDLGELESLFQAPTDLPGRAGSFTGGITSAAAQAAAGGQVGKALQVGEAALPALGFGAQAAGNRYSQAREEGATPNQALVESGGVGLANTALGLLPGQNTVGMTPLGVVSGRVTRAGLSAAGMTGVDSLLNRIHNPNASPFDIDAFKSNLEQFGGMELAPGVAEALAARRGIAPTRPGMAEYRQAAEFPTLDQVRNETPMASGVPTEATTAASEATHDVTTNYTVQHPPGDTLEQAQANHEAAHDELNALKQQRKTAPLTPEQANRYVELDSQLRDQAAIGSGRSSRVIPGMLSREALDQMDASPEAAPYQAKMDLDNFKLVNDTLGHGPTDLMLQLVGERMASNLPEGVTVGRGFNGDEFEARAQDQDALNQHLQNVANDLANTSVEVVADNGKVYRIGRIGLSYGTGENPETASTALEQQKQQKLTTQERFTRGQVEDILERRANPRPGDERRDEDLGPAARGIPVPVRGSTAGERGILGTSKAGGEAEGSPVPNPVEVGTHRNEGGEPLAADAGEGAQAGEAAQAPQDQTAQTESGVKNPSFVYRNEANEPVSVEVAKPEHQAELADIEQQARDWHHEINQIPGDSPEAKAIRARMHRAAGDSFARAKQDLHAKMLMDEAGITTVPMPDATTPEGTPQAKNESAKLREAMATREQKLGGIHVDETREAHEQIENAQLHEQADLLASQQLKRFLGSLSPEDQVALRDYSESKGQTPLDPALKKVHDEIISHLQESNKAAIAEMSKQTGEPIHLIEDDVVGYVMRKWLDEKATEPESLLRRMAAFANIHLPAPGEEPHSFDTGQRGFNTTDRTLKNREYHILTGPNGERTVVTTSNNRKLALPATGGEAEGKELGTFRRRNVKDLLTSRLGPAKNRLDRALEVAERRAETTLESAPAKLDKAADKLKTVSEAKKAVIKKIMRFVDSPNATKLRDQIGDLSDIHAAQKRGDEDFLADQDPAFRKALKDHKQAVQDELHAPEQKTQADIDKTQKALDKATAPSEKERLRLRLESLKDAHDADMEHMGETDPDQLVQETPTLAKQKKALDAMREAGFEKLAKVAEAKAKETVSTMARNQQFSEIELEKAAAKAKDAEEKEAAAGAMRGITKDMPLEKKLEIADRLEQRKAEEAHRLKWTREAARLTAAHDFEGASIASQKAEAYEPEGPTKAKKAADELEAARQQVQQVASQFKDVKPGDRVYTDENGNIHKLGQATVKEIEEATGKKANPLFAEHLLDTNLKLRAAARNLKIVNNLKSLGVEKNSGQPIPAGWKSTKATVSGLGDYVYPPDVARTLDHFQISLDQAKNVDSIARAARNASSAAVRSIFFSPVGHILNTASHAFVSRGWRNLSGARWGDMAPKMFESMQDIIHGDPTMFEAMREGNIPFMSLRGEKTKFQEELASKMKESMDKIPLDDPRLMKLAKQVGMAPAELVKGIYNFSSKSLWFIDDVMRLTAYKELKAQHPDWSPAQVGAEVNRHIASYRANYALNPAIRKVLENPALFMFSRYHQFAFSDFFHNMKGLVMPEAARTGYQPVQGKLAEYKDNLGRVASLAAQMTLFAPIISGFVQSLTGDKRNKVRAFGAATAPMTFGGLAANTEMGQKALNALPDRLRENLAEGPLTPSEAIQRFATATPLVKPIIEQYTGRDTYSGRPVSEGQIGKDVVGAIAPFKAASQIFGGKQTPGGYALGQFGIATKSSPASQLAIRAFSEQLPKGKITDADDARAALRVQVADATNGGSKKLSPEDDKAIRAEGAKNDLPAATINRVIRNASQPQEQQLAELVGKLHDPDAAMGAWRLATDAEKQAMAQSVNKVLGRAQTKAKVGSKAALHLQELKAELNDRMAVAQ